MLGVLGGLVTAFLPAGRSGRKISVEIPDGSGARAIAERLRAKGVIRSSYAFLAMASILGERDHMQAGDYEFRNNMTPAQVVATLARGDSVTRQVTLPEGLTLAQVARELSTSIGVDPARFLRIAQAGGKSFKGLSFTPPANLEGYLFPDTYRFRKTSTEREVVEMMLRDFDRKAARPRQAAIRAAAGRGIPLRKAVILASMVEREAKLPRERPLIAGVIYTRLNKKMRLQIDATVLYAIGHRKSANTAVDRATPSPYNTYANPGLPPTPIATVTLASLKAALHPAATTFLYYVLIDANGR